MPLVGLALSFGAVVQEQALATRSDDDPLAAVQLYVDAFNKADEQAMAACFAADGHILDGMAPHIWSGPSTARDWWRDVQHEAEHLALGDFFMTLGAPLHNAVTDDAAYVVAPATLVFKARGQQITQTGALFTVALRKIAGHWRIAAWTWSKGAGGGTGDVARSNA